MRKFYDWKDVQRYYDEGVSMYACIPHFGFTIGAWYKAGRRGAIKIRPFETLRYDWAAVQAYYDEGHTYRECRARFGFSAASWTKAVRRGVLCARARLRPLHLLLANGKSRHAVKRRLLDAGLLKNVCSECGLSEWCGKPLSIQIDHINGVSNDHRLENLRMLCPNCHSQTDTFASRNRSSRRKLLQEAQERL